MKTRKLQYPTELPTWKGLSFLPDNKVRKTPNGWINEFMTAQIFEFLTYLKNNPHPTIVPILDCHSIDPWYYTYDMPLLAKLSESESELIDLCAASADDDSQRKRYRHIVYRLGKKHPKLYQVVKKVIAWDCYNDLHGNNMMKDRYGNIKLVDMEGFWFSRFTAKEMITKITTRR